MDGDAINKLARETASQIAPMPTHDPVYAGMIGATVAGTVVILFSAFAGLNTDSFAGATGATIVCGFLAPYGYLKYRQHLHSKAWAKEYTRLRDQNAAPPL
jgi:hypothetical protein